MKINTLVKSLRLKGTKYRHDVRNKLYDFKALTYLMMFKITNSNIFQINTIANYIKALYNKY